MQRLVATVPESVSELCLIRLGIQIRKWTAFRFALGLSRAIDVSAIEAIRDQVGLLHSEQFRFNLHHHGVLQYWQSFETLEAWSHSAPHAEWWRMAVDRMRTKGDLGIYHETYLVPGAQVESISMNCVPAGLGAFGPTFDAVGPRTTSRDRLGRRRRHEG